MADWTCSTCGGKPCVNLSFCRRCRIADAKQAKRPVDPEIVRLRAIIRDIPVFSEEKKT